MRRDASQIPQTTPLNNNNKCQQQGKVIRVCSASHSKTKQPTWLQSFLELSQMSHFVCFFRNVRVLNPRGQMCYTFSMRVAAQRWRGLTVAAASRRTPPRSENRRAQVRVTQKRAMPPSCFAST